MTDTLSKETRSRLMSKIKSRNTKPELFLKKYLADFNYQPRAFGRPDFLNYKKKIVIFVDGCFWHQCSLHSKIPKFNRKYWLPKLKRNLIRAKEVEFAYKKSGWKVIRIWEHDLPKIDMEKFKKSFK